MTQVAPLPPLSVLMRPERAGACLYRPNWGFRRDGRFVGQADLEGNHQYRSVDTGLFTAILTSWNQVTFGGDMPIRRLSIMARIGPNFTSAGSARERSSRIC